MVEEFQAINENWRRKLIWRRKSKKVRKLRCNNTSQFEMYSHHSEYLYCKYVWRGESQHEFLSLIPLVKFLCKSFWLQWKVIFLGNYITCRRHSPAWLPTSWSSYRQIFN